LCVFAGVYGIYLWYYNIEETKTEEERGGDG